MSMLSSQFRIAGYDQRRRRRRLASIVETLYGQTGLSNVETAQQTILKLKIPSFSTVLAEGRSSPSYEHGDMV